MIEILRDKYDLIKNTRRLNVYDTTEIPLNKITVLNVHDNYLFMVTNKGIVYKSVSTNTEGVVNIDIDRKILNIQSDNSNIYILLEDVVIIYKYVYTNDKMTFSKIKEISIGTIVDENNYFTLNNNILYIVNDDSVIMINTQTSINNMIKADGIITAFTISKDRYYIGIEQPKSPLFIFNATTNKVVSKIKVRDNFEDYGNVINNIVVLDNRLSVSFYDELIYEVNIVNDTLVDSKEIFKISRNIEKVIENLDNIIVIYDSRRVLVYNKKTKSIDRFSTNYDIIDVTCDNLSLYISMNNKVYYYLLINVPTITDEYTTIDYDKTNNIILNSLYDIQDSIRYGSNDIYNFKLSYRNKDVIEKNISLPFRKNMYILLDKNNILLENNLSLSEKLLFFTLESEKYKFRITNIIKGKSNSSDLIKKLFIDNMSYYNNRIYFRIRYICKSDFNLNIHLPQLKTNTIITNTNKIPTLIKYSNSFKEMVLNESYKWVYMDFPIDDPSISPIDMNGQELNKHLSNFILKMDIRLSDNNGVLLSDTIYKEYRLNLFEKKDVIKSYNIDGDINNNDYLINDPFYIYPENIITTLDKITNPIKERLINNPVIEKNINNMDIYDMYNLSYGEDYKYKYNTTYNNVYINGKRMFSKDVKTTDTQEGYINTFIGNNLIKSTDSIILESNDKPLIESESFIDNYIIKNIEDVQDVSSKGIILYPKFHIGNKINIDNLKVFIKFRNGFYYKRLNPTKYKITFNKDKSINIIVNDYVYCHIGNEIMLCTNDITSKTLYYNLINEDNPNHPKCEFISLINFTENGEMLTHYIDDNENDIEVIVNNLVLTPNIDYCIINPELHLEIPSLVLFKGPLPVNSSIEIKFTDTNINNSLYFKETGSFNEIIINDENNIFVDGCFNIYVENKKISRDKYIIINRHIIILKDTESKNNICVKFSYRDMIHLEEYKMKSKYVDDAFIASNNIRIKQLGLNNFLSDFLTTNNISKIINKPNIENFDSILLKDFNFNGRVMLTLEYTDNRFKDNKDAIIDCNNIELVNFNVILNSNLYKLPYLEHDMKLDCNEG